MYALPAKAAIFLSACRLLPALAAILIPASVLSKKSAMLSLIGYTEFVQRQRSGEELTSFRTDGRRPFPYQIMGVSRYTRTIQKRRFPETGFWPRIVL